MQDIQYSLSARVAVQTVASENALYIEDNSAGLSVMLPLNEPHELSFFEDRHTLVISRPRDWMCVHVTTSRVQAVYLAEMLGYRLEIQEESSPEEEARITQMLEEDIKASLALIRHKPRA